MKKKYLQVLIQFIQPTSLSYQEFNELRPYMITLPMKLLGLDNEAKLLFSIYNIKL